MVESQQAQRFGDWLLQNRKYIRNVQDADDGSYRITPPREALRNLDIDGDSQLVVLPSDVAGQIGTTADPIFEIYEMPLDR